ncbi:6-phosphogluconolactonase [Arthrobacter castelli]|uniref:6-phosphogluconolactonase n=1 Tax=Arthrobacter castelli TaxID=271431 RepID=UPI0003F67F55|nr:6-phosphogluconolactonase [Arthrobacter castelli]
MNASPRVRIHSNYDALAAAGADRLIERLAAAQQQRGEATAVLTGGNIGISILAAVAEAENRDTVDWSRVNVWWGDERFLPASSPDRNAVQAEEALLRHVDINRGRVHPFGSADEFDDVHAAAAAYAAELAQDSAPFDVLLLGVGPDAHIASLFPDMDGVLARGRSTVGVENAPKPPPQRMSLTLEAIQSADEVWMVVAGKDKAGAVGLALAGAAPVQVPAAGATGRDKTLWLIDREAAEQVPESLLVDETAEQ